MARYGLDLERKNKFDSKRKRVYIISFLCFCLLVGVSSTLLLWRSLDYDFNNIFGNEATESTLPVNEEITEAPVYEGRAVFFLGVISDDKIAVRFINLISVDLFDKTIRVVPVDANKMLLDGSMTLADAVVKQSREFLITEAESILHTEIDRYVILTETAYKSIFNVFGDVNVFLEEEVSYDTEDMFLELKRGKNVLTPEKAYKYMKYVSNTYSGLKAAEKNADIIVAAFSEFYTLENNENSEALFTKIINYCETDISIVDYINVKDKAGSIIPASNKEKLRVYVAATVTGGDLYAEDGGTNEE